MASLGQFRPVRFNSMAVLRHLDPPDPAENPAPANTGHDPIHKMSETSYKNEQLVLLMIRQIISGSQSSSTRVCIRVIQAVELGFVHAIS